MWRGLLRDIAVRVSAAVVVIPTTTVVMWGLLHAVLKLLSIDPQAPFPGGAAGIGAFALIAACLTVGAVVGVIAWLVLFRAAFGYEQTSAVLAEGFGSGQAGHAARQALHLVFGDPPSGDAA